MRKTGENVDKKYELVEDDTVEYRGKILYRIKSCMDFVTASGKKIRTGDLGGYIEGEWNLSHSGTAWIGYNARVHENAVIYENAEIYGAAKVRKNARVFGNARIHEKADVYDNAWIWEDAEIFGSTAVCGNAKIFGSAIIYDHSTVFSNACVHGFAELSEYAAVYGNADICADASLKKPDDFLVVGPIGSRHGFTTFFHNRVNEIIVKCGCYCGGIDMFLKKVSAEHSNDKYAEIYKKAVELALEQIRTK